ncbi:hypothetical protein DICVIV_01863 [Dictyocaulus viviparus]|uniref:Uncharacterized protein n=1 Tax=Dictyocaulus viviparus TaxID=29172 RepID=A0A0D8Y6Z4_DICVI|nr:hypothetical protein DICVIV_01863 [Dictyocaulus viviparus]
MVDVFAADINHLHSPMYTNFGLLNAPCVHHNVGGRPPPWMSDCARQKEVELCKTRTTEDIVYPSQRIGLMPANYINE